MNQSDGSFRVLSARDPLESAAWTHLWQSWPNREVFAHPNYVKLFAREHDQPLCACWTLAEDKVLYPFVLRDLSREPYWTAAIGPAADIVSPYGYGGPFFCGSGNPNELERSFWLAFDAWARSKSVVSEFIRCSLFSDDLLPYPGTLKEDRKNVVRDLQLDEHALWMDFKHKVRKNVSKARRSALRVEADFTGESLAEFIRIYESTMRRRDAREEYFFSRSFFESLQEGLPGQFAYFNVILNRRVVSTELVLISSRTVYSFLGGTDEAVFDLRPNDLLKYEIMLWAMNHRKSHFVLGGGYQAEDGIYRYKAAFAPRGSVAYRVGYRTLSEETYKKLLVAKKRIAEEEGRVWQPARDYFPAYRAA